MTGMETAAISLGAAVIKVAMKLWLQDRPLAADAASSAVEVLADRMPGALNRRRFRRMVQHLEETVAFRLQPLLEREFEELPENEQNAAIDAVRETFERAALTDADLFDADLDAGYLDRYLRAAVPGMARRSALSEAGTAFYDRLLRECASTLVQVTTTLPNFQTGVLTEMLRRESEILDLVRQVLQRMPERHSTSDFELDYRQQVITTLDRMRIFGVRLSEPSRRYPLSVAYLSLSISADGAQDTRIENILPGTSRMLIRGDAGAGKTTLLQWIAVRCANRDMPISSTEETNSRPSWNDAVPLFVPLRRYTKGKLPTINQFLGHVGRHIADEMPSGWIRELLESGRAVVLIDGVDELAAQHRDAAREWLTELTTLWPRARYIVTSRPAAVEPEWLDSLGFTVAELLPMTPQDVRTFIHRWHDAMRAQCVEREEWEQLDWYEEQLLQAIAGRRSLRRIAETPLLCALLCALQREHGGALPSDRRMLYKTALEMLLGTWDEARGIERGVDLYQTEQVLLLQDLAYWLLKNGETDVEKHRVRDRIDARLQSLTRVQAGTDEVLQYLLERPGLLRQPIADRVDFIHRTFQEYLAAKAAVESDELGLLLERAELDEWREVVVMAAWHVSRKGADRLLEGLLYPRRRRRQLRDYYDPLAVACLENSPDLDPVLQAEVQRRAQGLIPPRTRKAADALAVAGDFVLDLLAQAAVSASDEELSWLIYTAARIGGDEALHFLTKFRTDTRAPVAMALVSAWRRFDIETYAEVVLAEAALNNGRLDISDHELIPGLSKLRNLTALGCTFKRGDGDLSFVRELDRLTTLDIADDNIRTLEPLAGTRLSELSVRCDVETLDLEPISRIPTLDRLAVRSPSKGWQQLAVLTELRSLSLNAYGTSISELPRLPELRSLALSNVRMPMLELGLANVRGQNDLPRLGFLSRPTRLELRNWPYLMDVSPLGHWWDSLQELVLAEMWTQDLEPLADLTELHTLALTAWHVPLGLGFLTALEKLVALDLSFPPRPPDLRPVRELPALRELRLLGSQSELDLSPLAGVRNLQITVSESSPVLGSDLLGEGSSVDRVKG